MSANCFMPFTEVDYPCYWFGMDGTLLINDAAKQSGPPLSDEAAMRRMLQSAMQEQKLRPELGAHTMPLLTDALTTRALTILPTANGVMAIACEEQEIPVNAFGSQMREPLTGIFAVLPLLNARLEDMDLHLTENIQTNGYRLLRLANNIEDGIRVEKRSFELRPVDVRALVDTLCYCVDSVCHGRGVPMSWELAREPLPVSADPRLLSDAFLNLIRNSLQYTRDGNHITIRLERVTNKAVLTVEDCGLGIRPEYLEQVFDPYFSVDPYGDTLDKPGLGLGLSVVRQTVQGFGGTVNVESRFGEGTKVFTSIPLDLEGGDMLSSDSADYLLNRFSPVYIQLCGYCRLPGI